MKVTKRDIQSLFKKCENAYETCWSILHKIKTIKKADKELAIEFIMFQEVLAMPLFELQELRNRISVLENELIGSKKRYKYSWFKKQMACLSNYKKGIDQVRNIGKGLGDAFVYFFYRNDLILLEKHFQHKRIDTTLGTVGLSGERYFVKHFKQVEGKMAIYHGISNILRYGDFSFYDLKTHKISAIGELKTRHIEETRYEMNLTMIPIVMAAKPAKANFIKLENLDARTAERLNNQINAIIDMLSPDIDTDNFNANIKGISFVSELQKLYNSTRVNQTNYLKVSSGLLYMSARFPNASLYTRIFNRKTTRIVASIGNKAIEEAKTLIKKDSIDNGIILGNLFYYDDYQDKAVAGTAPLFWYPLSATLLKDLYFSTFFVFTVFNPAHILDDLKDRGYNVKSKYRSATDLPGKPSIENFDSLISLITNHLQSESSIIEMIDTVNLMQAQKGKYGSILFKPFINIGVFGPTSPAE